MMRAPHALLVRQESPLLVDAAPVDAARNLHFHLACLREQAASSTAQHLRRRATVRSVAWSPPGCSPSGGCLLTVVTDDGKVLSCWRHSMRLPSAHKQRLSSGTLLALRATHQ